jgi:hypothetical protein
MSQARQQHNDSPRGVGHALEVGVALTWVGEGEESETPHT